jgi:hypothetical protein
MSGRGTSTVQMPVNLRSVYSMPLHAHKIRINVPTVQLDLGLMSISMATRTRRFSSFVPQPCGSAPIVPTHNPDQRNYANICPIYL